MAYPPIISLLFKRLGYYYKYDISYVKYFLYRFMTKIWVGGGSIVLPT